MLQENIRPNAIFFLSSGLFIILSILFSLAAFATENSDKNVPFSKTIMLHEVCQRIEIFGDVEIELSPTVSDKIIFQGTTVDINIISTRLKKGTLYVRAQWVYNMETTKIIVPAAMLKLIRVYGNAKVSSAGPLVTPNLLVVMNGEGKVKINSYGRVKVAAGDGYYLNEGESEISSSVRARILTRADYFYMEDRRAGVE